SIMSDAGSALMGIGSARGDDRAIAAAEMAVSSPLLEASIDGAHGVLLSIAGGSDLGLFEINESAALVIEAAHAEANIIFGAVIDDALGDEVRVTVIAAGFDGGTPKRREANQPALRREPATKNREEQKVEPRPAGRPGESSERPSREPAPVRAQEPTRPNSASSGQSSPAQGGDKADRPTSPQPASERSDSQRPSRPAPARPREPRPVEFDDDLDVPDFLK
ncbi:MAG: cell division protein FtsZ, partial [Actinomycetia bacterium]|nr:cell division protein FtsZ [Actinomycetes bacterium]